MRKWPRSPLKLLSITLLAGASLGLSTACQSASTGAEPNDPASPVAHRSREAPGTPEAFGDQDSAAEGRAPRVVVLVVVDQLRADLLDRYASVFTGGLARLRDHGFRYTQATHDHAATMTAPGHATISTGTRPSTHGVVANSWFEQDESGEWRAVENVLDPRIELLDGPGPGGAAPGVLKRSTLGEWLQEMNPAARVVSVSAKPRSAVLMAGKSESSVFWFNEGLGRFVTSTHYMDAYPSWVTDFNDRILPQMRGDRVWDLVVPEEFRSLARPDSADYEGDGVHTVFPHRFEDSGWAYEADRPWVWWATTPAVDRATRLLAQEAARQRGIGADHVPDLLAISFSQTDIVGHAYGPLSLEQLDNLYRLDGELGELLRWLDTEYGEDGYLLTLTADHGVADNPEAVVDRGGEAYRIPVDSAYAMQDALNRIAQRLGPTGPAERATTFAEALPGEVSWIEQGWSHPELLSIDAVADSFTVLQRASAHPGRYAGLLARQFVELRFAEGSLRWDNTRGTGHGSPYHYDRHVPFILYGAGVEAGTSDQPVSTTDIAPTLGEAAGVELPGDLDGVSRLPATPVTSSPPTP